MGAKAVEQVGEASGNVEKEVLQALLRGLKATRVAERLMQKLAQFVEQANLPKEVYERIRREVMWFTLPAEIKHAQLLSQGQSTPQDFARLVQYVQEAMGEGRISEAIGDRPTLFFRLGESSLRGARGRTETRAGTAARPGKRADRCP